MRCWPFSCHSLTHGTHETFRSKRDITSLLGLSKIYEMQGEFEMSFEPLNEVLVTYPWFVPAQTVKAKILAKQGEWEQCIEAAQKVLQ